MTITAVDRPFVLTFPASGHHYPVSASEVQRMLDAYPAIVATKYRVVLRSDEPLPHRLQPTITPATRGGGPAFLIDKGGK